MGHYNAIALLMALYFAFKFNYPAELNGIDLLVNRISLLNFFCASGNSASQVSPAHGKLDRRETFIIIAIH
jgi:hypothetical protein